MAGMLRVPRSRGAFSGFLLVLLGLWGGIVPFIGPYFHFAYTPDKAWTYNTGRLWLEILPGAVTFLGGLLVLVSRLRPLAMFGAWIAALAGAWFAVGPIVTPLWSTTLSPGVPVGGPNIVIAERIAFFVGLGVVIAFLAAFVLGRLAVIGVRDAALAEAPAVEQVDDEVPATGGATTPVTPQREADSGGTRTFLRPGS
ncbi:MAG TPA: hypothetical protein VG253_11060 [Streptosporangiaceae bacterium]|jgi:hypothetical protein|nr:hypothetical protein [Streptosporangiaceae bacterium]